MKKSIQTNIFGLCRNCGFAIQFFARSGIQRDTNGPKHDSGDCVEKRNHGLLERYDYKGQREHPNKAGNNDYRSNNERISRKELFPIHFRRSSFFIGNA